jgi:hypothetical protein
MFSFVSNALLRSLPSDLGGSGFAFRLLLRPAGTILIDRVACKLPNQLISCRAQLVIMPKFAFEPFLDTVVRYGVTVLWVVYEDWLSTYSPNYH